MLILLLLASALLLLPQSSARPRHTSDSTNFEIQSRIVANAKRRRWFGWGEAPPVFTTVNNCTKPDEYGGGNHTYTRRDIWDCFLSMGDGTVVGHAKDGVLDKEELQYGIDNHLTWVERRLAPSVNGILERCDAAPRDERVGTTEFLESKAIECMGDPSNMCSVYYVCLREFPALFPTHVKTPAPRRVMMVIN